MKKKPLCKQFAKDVCDILHIDAPKIEFVSSDQMRTDTQIAALIPGAILIKNDVDISPDLFLAPGARTPARLPDRKRCKPGRVPDKRQNDRRRIQLATIGSRRKCFCFACHVVNVRDYATISKSVGIGTVSHKNPCGPDKSRT